MSWRDEVAVVPDICKEIVHLVIVDTLKDDHVQFDRGEADIECHIDAGQELR